MQHKALYVNKSSEIKERGHLLCFVAVSEYKNAACYSIQATEIFSAPGTYFLTHTKINQEKMNATNTSLQANKPAQQIMAPLSATRSRNRIAKKTKKNRGQAKKQAHRRAYRFGHLLDHYECQHDRSELLDHHCLRACRHDVNPGDDHWCPSTYSLDQDLLDEIDLRARNRQLEPLKQHTSLDEGENTAQV